MLEDGAMFGVRMKKRLGEIGYIEARAEVHINEEQQTVTITVKYKGYGASQTIELGEEDMLTLISNVSIQLFREIKEKGDK